MRKADDMTTDAAKYSFALIAEQYHALALWAEEQENKAAAARAL